MEASDAWRIALAIFLILTALGLVYLLVRLAQTFVRLSGLLERLTVELTPLLRKAGTTLDEVNDELAKVGKVTDSAVDAAGGLDRSVRAATAAAARPLRALAGLVAGLEHAVSSFSSRRRQRGGVL